MSKTRGSMTNLAHRSSSVAAVLFSSTSVADNRGAGGVGPFVYWLDGVVVWQHSSGATRLPCRGSCSKLAACCSQKHQQTVHRQRMKMCQHCRAGPHLVDGRGHDEDAAPPGHRLRRQRLLHLGCRGRKHARRHRDQQKNVVRACGITCMVPMHARVRAPHAVTHTRCPGVDRGSQFQLPLRCPLIRMHVAGGPAERDRAGDTNS